MAVLSRSEAVLAALVDVLPVCSYVRADDAEMLTHWGDDPVTTVIVVDSLGDPREFAQVAARVSRRKPIVVFTPAGITPELTALARATGVILVDGLRDLVDTVRLLAYQPLPAGRRVSISGDVLHADALTQLLPCGPESDADACLVVAPFGSDLGTAWKTVLAAERHVTTLACVLGQDGLVGGRVPCYAYPEQAVRALSRVAAYVEWRSTAPEWTSVPDDPAARELVHDTPRLLAHFGITLDSGDGVEMVVRGVNDPVTGPLVVLGYGGVVADLAGDRAYRVPPLGPDAAAEMIADLRCSPLLYGYRHHPRADTTALGDLLTKVGRLVATLPEVTSVDLSPVTVSANGVTVGEARMSVRG
ncbi:hypothetical protein HerbRD11066_28750 [Herbidospora sp. RD11066]